MSFAQSFMGPLATSTVRKYRGPKDTLDLMAKHALGPNGERDIQVRQFTEYVIGQVWPKDYISEIVCVRHIFSQRAPKHPHMPLLVYKNDNRHVEFVKTPARMVREIIHNGFAIGDCDDFSTLAATMCLCFGREVEFVAMGFAPRSLSHVAVRVKEPKSGQWILLDGVAGPREREAAGKAVELMVKSLD